MIINKHIITEISYPLDYIQCVCGWEGKSRNYKDFSTHTKEAPPIIEEGLTFNPKYGGTFIKRKTVEESY